MAAEPEGIIDCNLYICLFAFVRNKIQIKLRIVEINSWWDSSRLNGQYF